MHQPNRPLTPVSFDADERLRWVERIARLMDSQFRLPGTRFRFGLDPLLGLVPVVGDLSSLVVSGALLLTMMRHGASGAVVVRMAINILLDTIIGAIPILGNLFDFAYKSNERNVALLRSHYAEGRHSGSGKGLVALLILGFVVVFGLVAWGSIAVLRWVWQYFDANPIVNDWAGTATAFSSWLAGLPSA
ncbi:DUF4112 domain-containing protein [Hymenobacter sp. BT683]|uniref:DUF4112 domain-containing protein n=1 Tax=Hymenobacter jeongseonensis TaxID=2791027 RepID=A0ABS0IJ73_9BACT|nr:DUF4112 domain-containing protein [Hymenobacter jeongseonensis]MBF9238427.1 DUF4112 domain-containing protein [Hymenobacter jeongseonensis]